MNSTMTGNYDHKKYFKTVIYNIDSHGSLRPTRPKIDLPLNFHPFVARVLLVDTPFGVV